MGKPDKTVTIIVNQDEHPVPKEKISYHTISGDTRGKVTRTKTVSMNIAMDPDFSWRL